MRDLCFFVVAMAAPLIFALDTRHAVRSLPGFGPPPTKHHSGFVEVDPSQGTHLFYYIVESQNSPSTDPMIMWMNGGPGASSLIGLFAEIGPLILNEKNALVTNPYAWNRNANLLFIEFGPGIGYSYCANSSSRTYDATDYLKSINGCQQSDPMCSPCSASDSSVAAQNLVVLQVQEGSRGPGGRVTYRPGSLTKG